MLTKSLQDLIAGKPHGIDRLPARFRAYISSLEHAATELHGQRASEHGAIEVDPYGAAQRFEASRVRVHASADFWVEIDLCAEAYAPRPYVIVRGSDAFSIHPEASNVATISKRRV